MTWLPVSIEAGREVTIPIKLAAPTKCGDYSLTIHPVGASGTSVEVPIKVVENLQTIAHGPSCGDYGQDHIAAIEFLQGFIEGQNKVSVLEVASGVNPHLLPLAKSGHHVIASDVCSNQMQLGAIFSRVHEAPETQMNLGYASFDAFNAPFQAEQFDGVAMFAALHHFPDPASFLRQLSTLVKKGGFIAVFCEPCDPSAIGEAYIRDLNAGINEQVFSVEEYREMFSRAGLTEHAIRNDGGSLKAILRKP